MLKLRMLKKFTYLTLCNHAVSVIHLVMSISMPPYRSVRRMAENGFAPPLGNFADISYLVELKVESFKKCLHSVLWGVSL